MKTRRIILHKDQVLYDIEGLAYKFTESTALEGKAKNAVAADHNETLDGRLLSRMMDVRDAHLRKRVRFALIPTTKEVACDTPSNTTTYEYNLSLSDQFDDNLLEVVKIQMHDYIVRGVLFDWYKRLGIQTFAIDAGEVMELEENIVSSLRTPSYMKAPLQPFGPKKSII
jgi:hypothetical protein